SGASAGNGIETLSSSDVIRIAAGARYVHATLRSTNGVLPRLSSAAGTETGEFEYDVPGTASFALTAGGATYGSLTLTRTAGTATSTAAGASALTVRGNLRINNGVTLNSTMTGALNLAGSLTSNGANLTFPASQSILFNGTSTQSVTGTASITLS